MKFRQIQYAWASGNNSLLISINPFSSMKNTLSLDSTFIFSMGLLSILSKTLILKDWADTNEGVIKKKKRA